MFTNWSAVVFTIIWMIGLFALVLIGYHYEQIVRENTSYTFSMVPELWFYSSVPFLFGVYFSLLFIKEWSFNMNATLLLCVSLPCLLLSFYSPFAYTFVSITTPTPSSFSVPIPFWIYKLNEFGIVPIVAGFTLITGLFGTEKPSRR